MPDTIVNITPAKKPRHEAWLRGEIVLAGEQIVATEASERFSSDQRKKALAILNVGPDYDEVVLKKAFWLRALEVHPDKVVRFLQWRLAKEG